MTLATKRGATEIMLSLSAKADPLERLAADEIARYVGSLADVRIAATTEPDHTDPRSSARSIQVSLGTAAPDTWTRRASDPLAPGAYHLKVAPDRRVTTIVGADPTGVLYGAYAFLRELGYVFSLSAPPLEPDALRLRPVDLTARPRFPLRGTQLWGLWFCGRDSWSWSQYRDYIDGLVALGMNYLDFPLYWFEPLYTGYTFRGRSPKGVHLCGLDVNLVRVGRELFGARPRFVSPDIPDDGTYEQRSRSAIALMQRVFGYARSRGVRICVGIELQNQLTFGREILAQLPDHERYEDGLLIQPSSRSAEELSRCRLKALVDAYPDCDYAIWQPEVGPFRTTSGSPHLNDVRFRAAHSDLGASGADLDYIQWVLLARRLMDEIKPGATVVTAGWGLERLAGALDRILPADVVRHTISWYEPQITVDRGDAEIFARVGHAARYTTWAEFDGHMWMPQSKTRANGAILDELEQGGVEGVALLHWRTVSTDLDVSSFARRCWGSVETRDHAKAWAAERFGPASAEHIVAAVGHLEEVDRAICRTDPTISFFQLGSDTYIDPLLQTHRLADANHTIPADWMETHVHRPARVIAAALPMLEAAGSAVATALQLPATDAQLRGLKAFAARVQFTTRLFRAHDALCAAVVQLEAGLEALHGGDWSQAMTLLGASLERARAADPEGVIRLLIDSIELSGATPDPGELGTVLSLNQKFLGGVRRLEGRLERLLARRATAVASARHRLHVGCGLATPLREHVRWTPWTRALGVPWSRSADLTTMDMGFGYELASPARAHRLTSEVGCWRGDERLEILITMPEGFRGRLRLYFYEEVELDSLFRRQEVYVDGKRVDELKDFFCRGDHWDEGVWLDIPVAEPPDGRISVEVVRTGTADTLISALEVVEDPR